MAGKQDGASLQGAGHLKDNAHVDGMEDKYCIVTGSNSGIGLQVARGLMRRGAHVVMACRNMEACEQAASNLRREGLPGSCVCSRVDLEDLASIRSFVRQQTAALQQHPTGSPDRQSESAAGVQVQAGRGPTSRVENSPEAVRGSDGGGDKDVVRAGGSDGSSDGGGSGRRLLGATGGPPRGGRHIDVLVNNAGVMGVSRAPDGTDRHLSANHLGPYLLTRLLLPHMTHGSRVVNVASRAHFHGSLELVTGPPGREAIKDNVHNWFWQYGRSKLCNVLFTAELQRRYGYGSPGGGGAGRGGGGGGSGTNVVDEQQAAAAAAAAAATAGGAGRRVPVIGAYSVSPGMVDTGIFRNLLPSWAQWLAAPLRRFCKTPEQGAEVVLYAACSPELQGRNVLFLHDCREMTPSAAARDPRLAADLWRVSAALVGLPAESEGEDDGEDRAVATVASDVTPGGDGRRV